MLCRNVMNKINEFYEHVLSRFPQNFSFAFAYGSGVFSQKSRSQTQNKAVIDFIFAVDDPHSWHKLNLKINKKHYSFLRYGGAKLIKKIQEEYGTKIYFNTLVPLDDMMIKYGVINTKNLIEDLLDWRTLYVSGRMHKPVLVLRQAEKDELKQAILLNLQSALHASLICLPESFSAEELYMKIAGLSYIGDFRMYVGEDKNKVKNIVTAQMEKFHELYENSLRDMPLVSWNPASKLFEQDCSPSSILHHLNLLPRRVQHNLWIAWNRNGRFKDMEEVLEALAYDSDCSEMVLQAVHDIMWWPNITQSLKGIATAGLLKSVKYSTSKMIKMVRSFH